VVELFDYPPGRRGISTTSSEVVPIIVGFHVAHPRLTFHAGLLFLPS